MLASTLLQGGIAGVVSLLFALLMFAAHIAMIVWTYSDAQTKATSRRFSGRSWCFWRRFSESCCTFFSAVDRRPDPRRSARA